MDRRANKLREKLRQKIKDKQQQNEQYEITDKQREIKVENKQMIDHDIQEKDHDIQEKDKDENGPYCSHGTALYGDGVCKLCVKAWNDEYKDSSIKWCVDTPWDCQLTGCPYM